jgi:aconitate decarboxylase
MRIEWKSATTPASPNYRHMVRVEIHLKDGTLLEETVEAPRGSEHSFASENDIVEKFEKLAIHALPRDSVERLRDAVLGLDDLEDAGEIARLLCKT